jgi:nuclear pore complex protein Nup155
MDLSSKVSDLISVSNLQDELLVTISQDSRINDLAKRIAKEELGGQILTINDLYNDYIDPLGYYELALFCFKLSDYRN